MNKILKTSLTILGILFFCILLKSGVKFYNVIGIVGLYGSVYYFMILNSEEIENFYLKEIMTVLISYNLQKTPFLLHREVYKNKFYLTVNIIIISLSFLIFIYKIIKNKKYKINDILIFMYEFLIISLPFYIIKSRGKQTIILLCLIVLIKIFYKKEVVFDKDIKVIYLNLFFLMLFSTTSFIGNEIINEQLEKYKDFIENIIFLMFFIQMKFSVEEIKKMEVIGITSTLIPIIPIIVKFFEIKNIYFRFGEDNPNVWAMEGTIWAIVFLYFILFKDKKQYVLLFLLYIFGVFLSGSRGGILTMLVMNFIVFILKYKYCKKVLIGICCFGILTLVGVLKTNNRISYTVNLIKNENKLDNSSNIRLLIYKEAIAQFKEKPINGLGFYGYQNNAIKRNLKNPSKKLEYIEENAYSQAHAHNNILNLLCTVGLLGAISYISLIFLLIKKLFKEKLEYYFIVIICLFSYEACGLVDCSFNYDGIQRMLYFIVGIYIAYVTPKINFLKKEKLEQ